MVQTVRVRVMKPRGSGGRVGWTKVVGGVDDTKAGGYAFEGDFLDESQVDLDVGSVLVGHIPVGSARSGSHWRAGVVSTEGVEWEDRTWPLHTFLDFRDHVKVLLCGPHDDVGALREEKTRLEQRIAEIDFLIEQAGRVVV